jgi:nicotinate-nucleotide adenylyltransferase
VSSALPAPLGILGGTFDPIHFGHLRLAEEAREALGLARVRVIPAGRPPHRERPGTSAEDRLRMTAIALGDQAYFELDDAEVRADQPSYTVPTLERLRCELGAERPLVLLLGIDAFLGLASWHRWRDLFALAHIGVATRPGYVLDASAMDAGLAAEFRTRRQASPAALNTAPNGHIVPFEITPLAISATDVRERLAQGRSARFLLPAEVLDYIQTHHLYES